MPAPRALGHEAGSDLSVVVLTGSNDLTVKPQFAVTLSLATLFAITCAFAAWWQPFHFHYAGGDPSDYVNNGVARAYEHASARSFYPEEFADMDRDALNRTFTQAELLRDGCR